MAYSQMPLEFEPGTSWAYCNMGVDVLGRLIEVASGRAYEDLLCERVFDPLGMKDTTFYPTPEQHQRAAEHLAEGDAVEFDTRQHGAERPNRRVKEFDGRVACHPYLAASAAIGRD